MDIEDNMTAEQFTYWLQGFMEINDPETLGVRETQIIKDHLKLVFDKQTPDRSPGLFDPTIPLPPKQWPTTNLCPGITYYPDPKAPPYTITCTDTPGKIIC